ncbi:hypothetical protein PRIPAC_94425 [Pristionchus pacificus]|uniref:Uncharacterized protein n=1 Tax=Pristionchus pacificus TaxID=54126 RepID=A0A2A6B9W9_PRIPA|nr:hypothetical protein PRIPAC_94425 [Pristionchus pacificus]|eukprot:PDM62668.1 hypothetical protein PRIPAC_49883 [Pristionchus pacificus]
MKRGTDSIITLLGIEAQCNANCSDLLITPSQSMQITLPNSSFLCAHLSLHTNTALLSTPIFLYIILHVDFSLASLPAARRFIAAATVRRIPSSSCASFTSICLCRIRRSSSCNGSLQQGSLRPEGQ